jgi:hypothetical protein
MRTLLLDIETTPSLAYVWRLWQENIPLPRLVKSTEILCFAAKWDGERKIHFHSVHHDGADEMLQRAHALLNEADAVVHYNGKKFDIPHLQGAFVTAGMNPPSPFKQIDLYATVKRQFKFMSGKLDHVARELGLGGKLEHEGFELWVKCMAGDEAAWRQMRRYNLQDVRLLQDTYDRLKPWIVGHPNTALHNGVVDGCRVCGGTDLAREGYAYTQAGVFQRYSCRGCGAWGRGSKRIATVELREVA